MVQMFHGIIPNAGTVTFQCDADYSVGVCCDPHSGATSINVQVDGTLAQTVPPGNIGVLNAVAGQSVSLTTTPSGASGYVIAFDGQGSLVANVI